MGEYVAYGWEAGERGYDFEADERWRVEYDKLSMAVLSGRNRCQKNGGSHRESAAWLSSPQFFTTRNGSSNPE